MWQVNASHGAICSSQICAIFTTVPVPNYLYRNSVSTRAKTISTRLKLVWTKIPCLISSAHFLNSKHTRRWKFKRVFVVCLITCKRFFYLTKSSISRYVVSQKSNYTYIVWHLSHKSSNYTLVHYPRASTILLYRIIAGTAIDIV